MRRFRHFKFFLATVVLPRALRCRRNNARPAVVEVRRDRTQLAVRSAHRLIAAS